MKRFLPLLPLLFAVLMPPAAQALGNEPILPVVQPDYAPEIREKILLGGQLFHDPRLSADNTVSCASCHNLKSYGIDGRRFSLGINGQQGQVNAPTVFNSGFNVAQFWDGRAATLEEQAAGPVHNPLEMGSNWAQVLEKLQRDPQLLQRFDGLYADGLNANNIQDAIATFERSLLTLDAPFDRYLRGDESAISTEVRDGYRLFKSYGCAACHQGVNVGGNMFHRLGALADYFADHGSAGSSDLGRFNVTGEEADRHVFKVPSLRLAAVTPPYFHNGSVYELDEAVRVMARYQLGRSIPDDEIALIVEFLKSLVGEYRRVE